MNKDLISVVPQYDEYGADTGLWMATSPDAIIPNLMLGWKIGKYRTLAIAQVEDGYEGMGDYECDLTDHIVELGTMDCSEMTDDEWEVPLYEWLAKDERVWQA